MFRSMQRGKIVSNINLDQYFTSWNEGETGYFKVASVKLDVTNDAEELERKAKEAALNIEAEVSYAWDLGKTDSDAWWLEWGGYALEEEIAFYAATSMPEVLEQIENFDPDNNDFECDSVEEFKEMMFSAFDEDLKKEDLKRGFQLWVKTLDNDVLKALKQDLESWTSRAKHV